MVLEETISFSVWIAYHDFDSIHESKFETFWYQLWQYYFSRFLVSIGYISVIVLPFIFFNII
ncbi:MAG: hypothetical protein D6B25_03620, partial [Desulfobulbaceae bacterium]